MFRALIAVLGVVLLFAYPAAAVEGEVSSGQLIDQAKEYDGQKIVYSGEVIGDILNAGDHLWLNVSDGSNAIGVWAHSALAGMVQVPGRYSQRGDLIQVSGRFHRACPEHGGDLDVHAETVTLLERGYQVSHEAPSWKVWLAVILTIAASALMASVFVHIKRKPAVR